MTQQDPLRDKTSGPLETSGIDRIIGYRLRRAQAYVFQEFKTHFDPLDLTPADYSTLVLISDNPGRKPSELAGALGIQRANFVPLINGLENRELITRKKSAADGRSFTLHLTDEGSNLLQRANVAQAVFEAKCVAELGGDQARDDFLDLLGRFKL